MIAIMIAKFIAVIIIGYLLGSIPTGVLIAKRFAKVDVTEYGSGKTGTTNVLRVAGKKAAAAPAVGKKEEPKKAESGKKADVKKK